MSSYKEQLRIIQKYKVKEGHSERFNCPFCFGWNTLGITNNRGVLEWHCFKASCTAHGINNVGSSIEGLKDRLNGLGKDIGSSANNSMASVFNQRDIPYLANVPELYSTYLDQYHVTGYEGLRYAPTEDRLLFPVDFKCSNSPAGYVGRKLSTKSYGPKWMKYGDCSDLFATCNSARIGVLVEDAISALTVATVPNVKGLALLGTVLTQKHKNQLIEAKLDQVLVCLDPDASKKSIEIARRLEGTINVSVRLIKDDLKYFNSEQIKEMLKL